MLETLGELVSADSSPVARLDTLKRVIHFDLQASHSYFDARLLLSVYTQEFLVFVCFRQTFHSLTLTPSKFMAS